MKTPIDVASVIILIPIVCFKRFLWSSILGSLPRAKKDKQISNCVESDLGKQFEGWTKVEDLQTEIWI